MFVHGTRTSSAIWDFQVEALSAASHNATALDLPGHGTREGEQFTFEGALAAIDDAVAAATAPPLLVGMSLGGYTSLAFAARHPSRLAGLVLSACSTEISGKPLHMYRELTSRLVDRFRPGNTWHIVADMLTAMHGYSALADLRRLTLPVWLVNGRTDPLRLEERRMLAAQPAARLHVIPGAGHDVNLHAPTAYTRILLDALTHLGSRSELRHV